MHAAANFWWRRTKASCQSSPPSAKPLPRTAWLISRFSLLARLRRSSRSSPAWGRCSRPRPASSTATPSCWHSKAISRRAVAGSCCGVPSNTSRRTGMRSVSAPGARRRAKLAATSWCCRPDCMPRGWLACLTLHPAIGHRRPTMPRGNITRYQDAPHSSGTSIPCRTAPGWASMPPSTSAGAASLDPTSNGRPASTTVFGPRSSTSFSISFAATIQALRPIACIPTIPGCDPKLYREGEPVPDFAIHGAQTHGLDGLVCLFGIESPGLTAALAIAEHVVAELF